MSMDKLIGKDFEKGLTRLKTVGRGAVAGRIVTLRAERPAARRTLAP